MSYGNDGFFVDDGTGGIFIGIDIDDQLEVGSYVKVYGGTTAWRVSACCFGERGEACHSSQFAMRRCFFLTFYRFFHGEFTLLAICYLFDHHAVCRILRFSWSSANE